jgi:AhpD family alkylhydroperoxidase
VSEHPRWRLPDALYVLRPEAAHLLDQVNERAWRTVEPALLEIIRLRVAWLIGNEGAQRTVAIPADKVDSLPSYATSERFTPAERACLAFAEQFVMDVGGTTPDSVDDLAAQLGGDQVRDFVTALYVVEFTQRLQMTSGALLKPLSGRSPAGPAIVESRSPLREMLRQYQNAVVLGDALDPVTTELVRLRCARTHRCRICQTLRLADAKAAGVDDAITDKIDFYERSDLPERHKTALRVTDAFITRPDTLTGAVVEQARSSFAQEELAELCLDITKWSTQKIHVALGTDGADALPTNEAGVTLFDFDRSGAVAGFWAG